MPRKRVLHVPGYSETSKVLEFSEATVLKCSETYTKRLRMKYIKYFYIKVPSKLSLDFGYRFECYKNYTALPTIKPFSTSLLLEILSTSRKEKLSPRTQSTAVFEKV